MIQLLEGSLDTDRLHEALRGRSSEENGVLLVLLAGPAPEVVHLLEWLASARPEVAAACFPALVHEGRLVEQGALLLELPLLGRPLLLSDDVAECRAALDGWMSGPEHDGSFACLVLGDGLWSGLEPALQALHWRLGGRIQVFGAGTGYADLGRRVNLQWHGPRQGAVLLLPLARPCGLGVRHGWHTLLGPLLVTRSEGCRVQELNWRPAFDVYRELLENQLDHALEMDGFSKVALRHPFAMQRRHGEDVVRDPILVGPEGDLLCVGQVPENSVLNIQFGTSESLYAAAMAAAADAVAGVNAPCLGFQFHCISRKIFDPEGFSRELRDVGGLLAGLDCPPIGALTLGEIASRTHSAIEFLNKSVVIGCLSHG